MNAESDLTLAAEIVPDCPVAPQVSAADKPAGGMPRPFAFAWYGRIGRVRCLAYALVSGLPLIAGLLVGGLIGGMEVPGELALVPPVIGAWATAWLALRAMTLRLHDLGRSGRWAVGLVGLCILAGFALSLGAAKLLFAAVTVLFALAPGSRASNRYGAPAAANDGLTALGGVVAIVLGAIVVASDLRDPWAEGAADDAAFAAEEQRFHQELLQQLEDMRGRIRSAR